MTKMYPIISLNGFLYVVDKSIKATVYDNVIYKESLMQVSRPMGELGSPLIVTEGIKVIASNDPSLTDIPKLPELEEEIEYPTMLKPYVIKGEVDSAYLLGYKHGYKAASKKKYTNSQIKLTIHLTLNYRPDTTSLSLEDYIFSKLNPIPKQVELEMKPKYSEEICIPDRSSNPENDSKILIPRIESGFVIVKRWIYEEL